MNKEETRLPARQGRKNIFLTLLFIFFIAIDQFSKYLIRSQGGFYICNKGIAFGIKIPEILFWTFWIVMIILLFYYISKNRLLHTSLFFLLIFSGAISNIIDRLYFGCVIDFIDLKVWPIFNLADSFIVLGAIMFILKLKIKLQKSK